MKLQEGHMANINKLAEERKLISAGPVKGGGGIFVLYAENTEEANEFLETDPAIIANRFILEIYPADFLYGELCLVEETKINMVSYSLIRHSGSSNDNLIMEPADKLLLQLNYDGRGDGISVITYDYEKTGKRL